MSGKNANFSPREEIFGCLKSLQISASSEPIKARKKPRCERIQKLITKYVICNFNLISLDWTGYDALKKTCFELRFDEETQEHYFQESEGGFQKQHRSDDEGNRDAKGATIPNRVSKKGMNNFEYLQRYYTYLNDECEYMVQKPKSKNSKFDIHDLAQVTLYQGKNAKVGVKLVQDMLPKVLYFSIIENYYSY